jgi:hypothetical protein
MLKRFLLSVALLMAATAHAANQPVGIVKGTNGTWAIVQCYNGSTPTTCTEHWVLGSGTQDPNAGFGADGDLYWRTDLRAFRVKSGGAWDAAASGLTSQFAEEGFDGTDFAVATLGAELATNPSFTGNITGWTGTNWAYEASNKARHTAGSTAALTQNVAVTTGTRYLVSITQTGRTAGSYGLAVGVATLQGGAYWDEDQVFEATETGTVALNVTPTTDFDGALTKVSIKPFATLVPKSFSIRPNAAYPSAYGADFRYSGGDAASYYGFMFGFKSGVNGISGGGSNAAFGDRALEQVTTGYWNHGFGYQALLHTTNGVENNAYGKWALANNTGGSFNAAFGNEALISNRTGGQNAAFGWRSLNILTTGSNNSALGVQAGRGMTTGGSNVCVGGGACWSPAGLSANALTTTDNNTYVGVNTGQASTTQRTNSGAFGFGAVVDADNWYTIGNGSVTDVAFGSQNAVARSRQTYSRVTRYVDGSTAKTLTDAGAAVAVWRCAIPSNDYLGGEIIWSTKSTDATDYRVTQGRIRFAGVNKAGTNTCTAINVVGTDLTASSNANTLVCTWTNVVNTTNCDLSVTCTDNTAASQTMSVNSRLDMPLPQTCTPQ